MRYRSPMARLSGSAKILLSLKSSDISLMICLINKLDSGVKKKTDEFDKIFIFNQRILLTRMLIKGLFNG